MSESPEAIMSDSSEDDGFRDQFIKYWSKTQKRMIRGAERARKPVSLRSLLGSYRWVYNGEPEADDTYRELARPEWGVFTLYRGPDKTTTPENIFGKFQAYMPSGKFEGLKVAEVKDKDSGEYQTAGNIWEINNLDWSDGNEEEGNGIAATETLDDNGHPFLIFYNAGGSGHCCGCVSSGKRLVDSGNVYLLKKQKDYKKHGPMEFLSKAEKWRLGFYFNDEDVMLEGSGSETDERDELDSKAGDGVDLDDDVDPYDREEALKLKRALKEEDLTVKYENEGCARVTEKRRASEILEHESKRQHLSVPKEEED